MNPSSEPQAYGAGIGGTFDLIEFLKRPQVILRLVAFVFAIIVFGSIAQEGYVNNICRYNQSGACGYGIAIGVIAFLATIFFTAVDVYFQHISRAEVRKVVVLIELGVSAVLLLLWFIGFCFMTDQWRREPSQDLPGWNGRNSVQAAIAFAFFSILVWGALVFFAVRRFRLGVTNPFGSNYQGQPTNGSQTYAGYPPAGNTGSFSQPPFTATQPPASNFEKPTY